MSEDEHVTRRELATELRSFRNEMRLLIAMAVLVINFDVPREFTAAVIFTLLVKAVWTTTIGRFWG